MRRALPHALIFAAATLLWATTSLAQPLDVATVKRMLVEIDAAIAKQDAAGVARHFAGGVTINQKVRASGGTETYKFSKGEYVAYLRDAWAQTSDYRYKRSDETIRITGPTRAVVTALVTESGRTQGIRMTSSSAETAVIELVDGRPLVVRLDADTEISASR
jgi:hypothetical protein